MPRLILSSVSLNALLPYSQHVRHNGIVVSVLACRLYVISYALSIHHKLENLQEENNVPFVSSIYVRVVIGANAMVKFRPCLKVSTLVLENIKFR